MPFFYACMCVGFWPACAHFFLVRRALLLGHACTFYGQCALFLFSVRAIFVSCARAFTGPCARLFSAHAHFFCFLCARFIFLCVGGATSLCARFGCFQVLPLNGQNCQYRKTRGETCECVRTPPVLAGFLSHWVRLVMPRQGAYLHQRSKRALW